MRMLTVLPQLGNIRTLGQLQTALGRSLPEMVELCEKLNSEPYTKESLSEQMGISIEGAGLRPS